MVNFLAEHKRIHDILGVGTGGTVSGVSGDGYKTITCDTGNVVAITSEETLELLGTNGITTIGTDGSPDLIQINGSALLPLDGTRSMSDDLNLGGNAVVNVGNVDGRNVSVDGSTLDSHIQDTSIHFEQVSIQHNTLSGLSNDDHTQYFNTTRGDARYYTQAQTTVLLSGINHGDLENLLNNDHPQYRLVSDNISLDSLSDVVLTSSVSGQVLNYNGTNWVNGTAGAGVSDHGLLTGLSDDDHSQYHNDTRGDARYYTKTEVAVIVSGINHGDLENLANDDHSQYPLLAGRSGGQTLYGGTAASNSLTFGSSSNSTKGKIYFGANCAFDEAAGKLGIGLTAPSAEVTLGQAGATSSDLIVAVANYGGSSGSATADSYAGLRFGVSAGPSNIAASASIRCSHKSVVSDQGTNLLFLTRAASGGAVDTRMTLGPDGTLTLTGPAVSSSTFDGVDVSSHTHGGAGQGGTVAHTSLGSLNSTTYYHLTQASHTDLTDGGATTLHKHDHGGMDGLSDNDHPQYALAASGIANGNSHDHSGGDGAQVDHGGLGGLTDDDHSQYVKAAPTNVANEIAYYTANRTIGSETNFQWNPSTDELSVLGTTSTGGKLRLAGGEPSATFSKATVALGYSTTGTYPNFIHTRHNAGSAASNAIDFYTSDGTSAGVFPTNAVHGLTINNAQVGIGIVTPIDKLTVSGQIALVDATNNRIYHTTGALNLGTDAATTHSLGIGDILVGGKLEVDGATYLDGSLEIAAGTDIYSPDALNLGGLFVPAYIDDTTGAVVIGENTSNQSLETAGSIYIKGVAYLKNNLDVTGNIIVAGTVDGIDISLLALSGVAGGNSHDHSGGDGAQIDHTGLSNLNSATYTHLTATNHTDLTDSGATTLHKHDHGNMDGLSDNDHPQYWLISSGISLDNLSDVTINSPVSGQNLVHNGSSWLNTTVISGTGDVVGPTSATDNAICRYNLTTGKIIQDSLATINDSGGLTAVSKSFLIPHPTRLGMKLQYGSLEGPEHGVYIRGKANSDKILLPSYWLGLIDPETITVQLTPIGRYKGLFVKKIQNLQILIGGSNKQNHVEYFYFIQAERLDIPKLVVEF